MKPEHFAAAEVARSPEEFRRNATLLFISTLTIMSGATISASLPGIAARFADVENVALLSRLVLTLPAVFIALFNHHFHLDVIGASVPEDGHQGVVSFLG